MDIHYDEFCDLLGGIVLKDLPAKYKTKYKTFYQKDSFERFHRIYSTPDQYFFIDDSSGFFPLEVLYLKVYAYVQLLKETRLTWLNAKKPHLGINPESIIVSVKNTTGPSPARWGFEVKLSGEPSVQPDNISKDWVRKKIFKPAASPDEVFSSPKIINVSFLSDDRIDTVITDIKEISKNKTGLNLGIYMDFSSGKGSYPSYDKNDIIHVSLNCNDPNIDRFDFWGSISSISKTGFQVYALLDDVDEKIKESLDKIKGSTFLGTPVSVYKSYHFPCDIYSLGKVLLITLLKNKKNDLSTVDLAVNKVVSVFNTSHTEKGTDIAIIKKQLLSLLTGHKEVFAKKNVLFRSRNNGNTDENQRNKIPEEIWDEILVLAFTLLTNIDGFSLCSDTVENNTDNTAPLDEFINSMENIQSMLYIELFKSHQQKSEILSVLNETVEEPDAF